MFATLLTLSWLAVLSRYPFKKVREATVAMTCYCHICGKMKSGKDLKSHYEKVHYIDLKDSYQVICLVEKAEDFLQKCKVWETMKKDSVQIL